MIERLKIIGEVILQEKGFFSVRSIARKTGLSLRDVRIVLDRLFRSGFLLRFKSDPQYPRKPGRPPAKRLAYQNKSRKLLAQKFAPKLKENTALDRAWSVIRNKSRLEGSFTLKDVVTLGGVNRETARWFLKLLRRAGYVRPEKAGGPKVEWVLLKDPGPKRPYVTGRKRRERYAPKKLQCPKDLQASG